MSIPFETAAAARLETPAAAREVVAFWREAGAERWFAKDDAFDRDFHARFLGLHMEVAARLHDDWMETPEGALALLLLVDQFPRNAFRGTAHMFATDPLALLFAREALARHHGSGLEPELRPFLVLPFMHSEEMHDQHLCVELSAELDQNTLDYAHVHRDIIERFRRFPHRNPLLGRQTTPEEAEYLAEGGFSG